MVAGRRRTWWSATSRQKRLIGCGSPTSPTFRHGPAFSISPSCSMCIAVALSAGRWPPHLPSNWCLTLSTWRWRRGGPRGVIHHSDQGSQYTSIEFGHRCRDAGVRPSMGSVGDAYDNAMCESFFATLECELLARGRFKTQAEARNATFAFIEGFYNPRRRHSSIGYLSPIDYERRHQVLKIDPDADQRAVVLTTVKDKPCGRPQEGAVLDRRCARQPHHRAGRDGRMAPPGVEPKNATKLEDKMTPQPLF